MKIKKLFHWLYAILMLLPVFYIGGRVLYTIFNKNAKDSYYGETINVNTSHVVETFTSNNTYTFNKATGVALELFTSDYIQCDFIEFNCNRSDVQTWFYEHVENLGGMRFYLNNNVQMRIQFFSLTNTYIDYWGFVDSDSYYIKFHTINSGNFNNNTKFDIIEYNNYSFLDNAFEYSVNQLNDVPLFSWAQNSFLNQPFTYISGLFGIAASNPINTMLSYWLSISIIWLVFDLVMYVPLLVHRWIDKGGID